MRLHDLRHTGLSRIGNSGATFAELKAISGHRTSLVMPYVKSDEPPLTVVERAPIE